jgi:teichuronic acid biosynthesis glycosyltransferase TuaC
MLKLAVVTRYFPNSEQPTHGRSAYQTLRVLARKAEVQVFYPNSTYPSFLKSPRRTYNRLDPSFSLPDIKVSYYDYPALPLVSRPFNGRMAARILLPHVRSFAPDLIFSFVLYPYGYAALEIGKALSVPVVTMGIGSDVHSIGDRISAMHTRTVLREADLVLAVSDDLRKRAVAMGAPAQKTRAVINGCDPAVFHVRDRGEARRQLGIDPAAEAVVFVGRIDVKKGLRELVEAAAKLRPTRPNLHVYLVGEGPDSAAITSAIQASDAAGYIHALPPCTFDEVAIWAAAANLVTLPSYMEGCPNVVLEALACGRPVVATNVGGIPEIMSDACGRLVPRRDAAALAQALAAVLDTTWDAAAISAQWSRSWSNVADELLELFESLVSSRQGVPHGR